MKVRTKEDVFLDTVTGMYYIREFKSWPVKLIDGPGVATVEGHLLRPSSNHPDFDWSHLSSIEENERMDVPAQVGYIPWNYAQELFVTEEQLKARFKFIGRLTFEVDMEAQVRHYESECCDFSNRESVADDALRHLGQHPRGTFGASLYVIIKEFIQKTRASKGPVFLNRPDTDAANAHTALPSKENW